ncbi:hypothetical protein EC609_10975 [Achromobacter denitrificans]|nr:hypothetical protein EC609_10975 [Achromobacter denitrificans]
MIVKALRVGLGQLIVAGDALTRPRPQKRTPQGQAAVNSEAGGTRWMYESSDIIAYLEQRFANVA